VAESGPRQDLVFHALLQTFESTDHQLRLIACLVLVHFFLFVGDSFMKRFSIVAGLFATLLVSSSAQAGLFASAWFMGEARIEILDGGVWRKLVVAESADFGLTLPENADVIATQPLAGFSQNVVSLDTNIVDNALSIGVATYGIPEAYVGVAGTPGDNGGFGAAAAGTEVEATSYAYSDSEDINGAAGGDIVNGIAPPVPGTVLPNPDAKFQLTSSTNITDVGTGNAFSDVGTQTSFSLDFVSPTPITVRFVVTPEVNLTTSYSAPPVGGGSAFAEVAFSATLNTAGNPETFRPSELNKSITLSDASYILDGSTTLVSDAFTVNAGGGQFQFSYSTTAHVSTVPEPMSASIFAFGAIGCVMMRRRRNA
jgi:hypothetical protein